MLVLSKKVGLSPEAKFIKDSKVMLRELQEAVDGYIEAVTFDNEVGRFAVICNEEGRLRGLPHNCVIDGVDFVGDIIIAGVGEDDFSDIPDNVFMFFQRTLAS